MCFSFGLWVISLMTSLRIFFNLVCGLSQGGYNSDCSSLITCQSLFVTLPTGLSRYIFSITLMEHFQCFLFAGKRFMDEPCPHQEVIIANIKHVSITKLLGTLTYTSSCSLLCTLSCTVVYIVVHIPVYICVQIHSSAILTRLQGPAG